MTKTDFKKTLGCYRAQAGTFQVVDVPRLHYLMVDGHGDPNGPAYAEAMAALFPVAYALKFASKRELGRDYTVMPLEALWWSEDMTSFTTARDKERWDWTAMVMVPDWTTATMLEDARAIAARKRGVPASLDRLRMDQLDEGRCVQTLHVGSYDEEGPVLARMHEEFILGAGLRRSGKHHEIYLSDARRVAPEKRRTILRQPVASV